MAGRIKHMQRSHRSHNRAKEFGVFNAFRYRAYVEANTKEARMTTGERLASFFRSMVPSTASK